jgi:hypothetical protein
MTYRTSLRSLKVEDVVVNRTQRYAHLSHDTLLDATNGASRAIGVLLMPLPPQLGHMCPWGWESEHA